MEPTRENVEFLFPNFYYQYGLISSLGQNVCLFITHEAANA